MPFQYSPRSSRGTSSPSARIAGNASALEPPQATSEPLAFASALYSSPRASASGRLDALASASSSSSSLSPFFISRAAAAADAFGTYVGRTATR